MRHESRYNEPMAVRLIALDIDGTLLDSRWQLPEANRAAIVEAASRGVEVALVTGRRYDFAMPIARQLECPLTMIASNGAVIRTSDGVTHLQHLLPRGTARQILVSTKDWREDAAVIFDRPGEKQLIVEAVNRDDAIRAGYFERNREYIDVVVPLESCLTTDPVQVMFWGRVDRMRAVESVLRSSDFTSTVAIALTLYEARDFAMIDVLNPACTKGSALEEWAAVRGYLREEILAIGDNHNDAEMLQFAGIPVVMGNAVAELKNRGWHETRCNDESGVAAAIERFVLREAPSCA